jgi:nicotinate-nucleotide adenylyltransferase
LKRIGLFGGTFNPIHSGHIRAAASVREGFGLDTVVLIPASIPPHKHSRDIAPAHDRLEMVRLAAADLENILVSDVELVRSGPSYTIDTVRHLRRQFDRDTQMFFIVGGDAFLEIDTWKNFDDLLLSIPMIVLDRPADHNSPNGSFFQTIAAYLQTRISGDYLPDEDGLSFSHPRRQTVYLYPGEMIDMSSTQIRQRIGRGETLAGELPPSVEDYIQRKGLYR